MLTSPLYSTFSAHSASACLFSHPFHSSPLFQNCSNTQRGKLSAGHRHILYITVISFLIFCRLSGLIFCRLEQMVPQRCHVDAKELEHNGALMWKGRAFKQRPWPKKSHDNGKISDKDLEQSSRKAKKQKQSKTASSGCTKCPRWIANVGSAPCDSFVMYTLPL